MECESLWMAEERSGSGAVTACRSEFGGEALDQDCLEADKAKQMGDVGRGVEHAKAGAGFDGCAVKGDEGRDSSRVEALGGGQIDGELLAADTGEELVEERGVCVADQFRGALDDGHVTAEFAGVLGLRDGSDGVGRMGDKYPVVHDERSSC